MSTAHQPRTAGLDVAAYLERIGYTGPAEPTLENLRAMHRAHFLNVPFENLDIARGVRISVDSMAPPKGVGVSPVALTCREGLIRALAIDTEGRERLKHARVAQDGVDECQFVEALPREQRLPNKALRRGGSAAAGEHRSRLREDAGASSVLMRPLAASAPRTATDRSPHPSFAPPALLARLA